MRCLICHCDESDLLSSDIDQEQCVHDYECLDCGCKFTMSYVIANTEVHKSVEDEDYDDIEDDDEDYVIDDDPDDDYEEEDE